MTRLGLDTQESKALVSVIVADVYAFIYPDVNTKDTTFNLFLPSRVYFLAATFRCEISQKRASKVRKQGKNNLFGQDSCCIGKKHYL